MAPRPFTAEEDAYIQTHYATEPLGRIAATLDRALGSVQQHIALLIRRGVLDPRTRYYQPGWTAPECDYLRTHWGLLPDSEVAGPLGRSLTACALKAKRLGLTRKALFLTAYDVARLLRVDIKTVTRWIGLGWLPANKSPVRAGRNRCWQIRGADLATFLTTHLDKYEYRRIDRETHRYWYNLVRAAVAAHPEAAVERPPRMHRDWTPAEDEFLRTHWGRLPDADVAAALDRPVGGCDRRAARLRLTRTATFLTLPAAARALEVPPTAVRRWIDQGLLPARKSVVGGNRPYRNIAPAAVRDFRQTHAGLIAATRGTPPPPRKRGQDTAVPAPPCLARFAGPPALGGAAHLVRRKPVGPHIDSDPGRVGVSVSDPNTRER
jgi:hypothetical protein